ncbi:hypothetical protein E6W26_28935 [Pseudomonas aeruginosa]|uniref:hypothetical protein n=1 Tax=Pseudomonas aeruginosa TaxID=287 RepID=UPI00109DC7E4|nr:hypothetical protein [Pseudomonas aeruginosa]EKV1241301.1 hypothetical protein [Pseudomonas aeruginosa]EKV8586210.1 hypothetical protein [Pseudomonas aeruginosa]ELN5407428.1 hypothetical protein [Pseudomonas aeruginosa]ELP1438619.1 hypothetical protein [Pseudomonas aeruginosa]THB16425.1 hypothetical protein E6W26_28935 [Pseudomonas aeruginosa]
MDTSEVIYVIKDIETASFNEGLNLALSDFSGRVAYAHTLTTSYTKSRVTYLLTTSNSPVPANAQSLVYAAVLDEISGVAESGSIVAVSYCVKGDAVSLLLDTQ